MAWLACGINGCQTKLQGDKGRHQHILKHHPGYYGTLRLNSFRHRLANFIAETPLGYIHLQVTVPAPYLLEPIMAQLEGLRFAWPERETREKEE